MFSTFKTYWNDGAMLIHKTDSWIVPKFTCQLFRGRAEPSSAKNKISIHTFKDIFIHI